MKKTLLSRLELRISVIIISLLILNICFYSSANDNDTWAQGVSHQSGQPVTKNMANVSLQTRSTPVHPLPIIPYIMFPQQQTQTQSTSTLESNGYN